MKTVAELWNREELTPVQTRATLALFAAATVIYAFAWGNLGFHLRSAERLTGDPIGGIAFLCALGFLLVLLAGATGHLFNYILEFAAHGQSDFRMKPMLERQFSILLFVGCAGLALALAFSTAFWFASAFPLLGSEGALDALRDAVRAEDPHRYAGSGGAMMWMPGVFSLMASFMCLSVSLTTMAAVAMETSKNELLYAGAKFYLSALAGPGRWLFKLISTGGQGPAVAGASLIGVVLAWALL